MLWRKKVNGWFSQIEKDKMAIENHPRSSVETDENIEYLVTA